MLTWLVSVYFDLVEIRAKEYTPMHMQDWIAALCVGDVVIHQRVDDSFIVGIIEKEYTSWYCPMAAMRPQRISKMSRRKVCVEDFIGIAIESL